LREQIVAVSKFRKGEINCLVATSIAEEGLDIPACNLVVRFDLFTTTIQYIQSRGRARHESSDYLIMIEKGNQLHARAIKEHAKNEARLREVCTSLPEDRKLQGISFDSEYFLSKERHMRTYKEQDTGATLNYRTSMAILADFVGSLPWSGNASPSASYH